MEHWRKLSARFSPKKDFLLDYMSQDAAETTNGDSPGCTSSSPSPERIDEVFCGESPLEKSIADPAE
jgi:hypothetical protein